MTRINELIKKAKLSAIDGGHDLGPVEAIPTSTGFNYGASCKQCGASLVIDPDSQMPIAGTAAEMFCPANPIAI